MDDDAHDPEVQSGVSPGGWALIEALSVAALECGRTLGLHGPHAEFSENPIYRQQLQLATYVALAERAARAGEQLSPLAAQMVMHDLSDDMLH